LTELADIPTLGKLPREKEEGGSQSVRQLALLAINLPNRPFYHIEPIRVDQSLKAAARLVLRHHIGYIVFPPNPDNL
jgi:hypothetical protein